MNIPDELFLIIVEHMDTRSTVRMRRTCQEFYNFISGIFWWSNFKFSIKINDFRPISINNIQINLRSINTDRKFKRNVGAILLLKSDVLFRNGQVYASLRDTLSQDLHIDRRKSKIAKSFNKINDMVLNIQEQESHVSECKAENDRLDGYQQPLDVFEHIENMVQAKVAFDRANNTLTNLINFRKKEKSSMMISYDSLNKLLIQKDLIESALDW